MINIWIALTILLLILIISIGLGWLLENWGSKKHSENLEKSALKYKDEKGRDIYKIITDGKVDEKEALINRMERDVRRANKIENDRRRDEEDRKRKSRNEEIFDSGGNKEITEERGRMEIPNDTTDNDSEQAIKLHKPESL